ncbi:MAG: hypothetical protein NC123_17410 [Butyrivibrio sp.]|nr:hypothetical protein [Acetatifactor muris]MCM1561295.1 hypothetical protein [Butyrivibrio sp.]
MLKGEDKGDKIDEVSARVNGKIEDAVITEAKGNIFEGVLATTNAAGEDISLDAGTEDTATIKYLDEEGNIRTKDVTFKTGSDAKTTAANLAEAINKDDTLKHIFKATSNAAGKLSVESKLDGTKTDNTKNAVQDITFESELKADKSDVGGAKRLNTFEDDTDKKIAATGEAYSFAVGTVAADGSLSLNLQDGESITINGKTYTYDENKADSAANSFKTLEDLQKLIGNEYNVDLQITGKMTTDTYTRSDAGKTQADADAPSLKSVTEEIVANLKDKTKFADAAAADFDTTITSFANSTDPAPTQNDGVDSFANAATGKKELVTFEDMQLTLTITEKATTEKPKDVLNFSLQVGADTTEENKISVDIESMSAKSLGIDKVSVLGKDSTNADKAVNTIADAIAQVSKQRSALGAIQNRLEHTINNLDNVVENTTSAESAIRDTDMATQMVQYSNQNILAQAGQSMLAQANQSNQGVLSLLG